MKITTASSVASLSYCTVESAQDSHFHVLGWAFANFTLTLLMRYSMAWWTFPSYPNTHLQY